MWTARVVWATLPLTVGTASGSALGEWSRSPSVVAALLLWAAWTAGLVALVSPRPWGFTLLRVVSTATVLVAVAASPGRGAAIAAVSLAGAVAAAAAASSAPVAHAAANTVAYVHEKRFPLRVPTPITVMILPPACTLIAASIATGPLLIADGAVAAGIAACAGGIAIAGLLVRAIHVLAQRRLVLQPAGIVIADPLNLAGPVLLTRAQIESVRKHAGARPAADALDLRLGTLIGSTEIRLREPTPFALRRHGNTAIVESRAALVAPLRAEFLIEAAREHLTPVV